VEKMGSSWWTEVAVGLWRGRSEVSYFVDAGYGSLRQMAEV